jgi:hypothetical protein
VELAGLEPPTSWVRSTETTYLHYAGNRAICSDFKIAVWRGTLAIYARICTDMSGIRALLGVSARNKKKVRLVQKRSTAKTPQLNASEANLSGSSLGRIG